MVHILLSVSLQTYLSQHVASINIYLFLLRSFLVCHDPPMYTLG